MSVEDRLPEKLSPSRAKDFMQCPKLFYYKTILKISTPPTEATLKGTLCHHVFERIFDHPREERTPETALAYLLPAWDMMQNPLRAKRDFSEEDFGYKVRAANGMFREEVKEGSVQEGRLLRDASGIADILPAPEDHARMLAAAELAVLGWFQMENPQKFDPLERELYVSAKLAGCTLHGFIDRLDRTDQELSGVRYWISDYKTGKPPRPQYADDAFFQLFVYALLVEEIMGVRPYQLRLIYVREGRKDAVLTRNVTEEQLKKTRLKVQAVWKGIVRSAKTNTWETRKQVLCDWCFFKDVCPAWNPELEGLLPEEVALKLER